MLGLVAGCAKSSPVTGTRQLPVWLPGVWSREWIERRGIRTSTFTVRYLQTPSWFGDVRFPVDRPKFPAAASFADLTDAELRSLAKQRGFVGQTTTDGLIATWHHEIDFQPNDGSPDIGRLERVGAGRMYEHALDRSYTEHWWSLSGGDGRFLTVRVERGGRLDQLLVVAGDYFYYARNRAKDLPAAASLDSVIASAKATRAQIIEYLDCELSVGRIRGGVVPWEIQYSTLPWREGRHLELVDRIGAPGSIGGLAPRAEAGETWTVPVNTVDADGLGVLFGALVAARPGPLGAEVQPAFGEASYRTLSRRRLRPSRSAGPGRSCRQCKPQVKIMANVLTSM